jgi:hypothetical protein
MSDTPIVESVTDDLDLFSAELFGQSKVEPEATTSEEEEPKVPDSDAPETQTDDDTVATEDVPDDADVEAKGDEPEEKPQPKKSRFQERIDELNARAYAAERRAEEAERKLNEKAQTETKNEQTIPTKKVEPSPDDTNEDGTDKYPLGEFDPQYIRDLTKHALNEERQSLAEAELQRAQEDKFSAEKQALQETWTSKVDDARERYPDFQEKGEELLAGFNGLEPTYSEYLGATLMSMDYGPDVLYYLANNPDEATAIVNSGPTKATIALGRLEAKFAVAEAEKTNPRPRVSNAPVPPTTLKGANAVMPDVPDDTDDLDAFSKKLFKKK